MKNVLAALLFCFLVASPPAMLADVTYTYTGQTLGPDPGYSFPYSGYSFDGSFTVASPLNDPTLTDITSQVTSFSFGVVCQVAAGCGAGQPFGYALETFTQASSLASKDFQVQTDSTGAITNYLVALEIDSQHAVLSCYEASALPSSTTACTGPGWGNGGGDEVFDGGGTVGIVESHNSPAWTSAVPEPSSAGVLSAGLLGLLLIGTIRRPRLVA